MADVLPSNSSGMASPLSGTTVSSKSGLAQTKFASDVTTTTLAAAAAPTKPNKPAATINPSIKPSNAPVSLRQKFVPIRPSFRPLLPKPSPSAGTGSNTLLKTGSDLLLTPTSVTLSVKPKPSTRALEKNRSTKASAKVAKAPKVPKAPKASKPKAATKKQSSPFNDSLNASNDTTLTDNSMTAMTFTTSPDMMTTANSTDLKSKKPRKASLKKKQQLQTIPATVSPASLITKRSKSTAGSARLAETLSPLHMELSAESSNFVLSQTAVASLPSPHLSPCSSPSSPLAILDSVTTATPPSIDSWASQTTDEILAASATEDFFWLSPKSLVSDTASIDSTSSKPSLSLSLHDSSPESELDDFYLGASAVLGDEFALDASDDSAAAAASFFLDSSATSSADEDGDADDEDAPRARRSGSTAAGSPVATTTTGVSDVMATSYVPEPFCDFEFSPEPVSLAEPSDLYGFLDLAINI